MIPNKGWISPEGVFSPDLAGALKALESGSIRCLIGTRASGAGHEGEALLNLAHGVMVARQILILFVKVRILMGQPFVSG